MSAFQIGCVIGIAIVMFILGRKTKQYRFPIVGEFDFTKNETEPSVIFKASFKQISQFKYVVFRIRGRISDDNERRSM